MKFALLHILALAACACAFGKPYYVSSSGGSDSNDGSEAAPFKTIAAAPSENAEIFLKRGDVFYGAISGFKNCKIGAYGEGAKPVICGLKIVKNPAAWERLANDVWRIDLTKPENFDGYFAEGKRNNIGAVYDMAKDKVYGHLVTRYNALNAYGDFWVSGEVSRVNVQDKSENFRYLYFRSKENPSSGGAKIAFSTSGVGISNLENCEVDSVAVKGFGVHGVARAWGCKFRNMDVDLIGGSVQLGYPHWVRLGNGFEFWVSDKRPCSNNLVEGGVMLVADSDVDIDGAAFEGNSVVKGKGGAIAVTRNVKTGSTLSVKDSKFKGNSADSGGAVAIYHHSQDDKSLASSAVMANVEFSGNSAANQGGAIYIRDNASLEIVADKDVLHSGNTASSGGFMYIGSASNPSSVTFTANGGATVTIGSSDMDKSDKSLDSIASFDEKQSIAKNGAGVLTVNSSMADYKGSLSVTGGSMSVNNTLGSERVSVENGASLSIDALDVDVSSARDRLRIASASGEGSSLKIGSVNVGISSKITAQVPETLAPYSEAVHVVDVADSARVETGDINLNVSGANASVENKITTIFSTGGEAVVNGDINVTVENGASVKAIYAGGYNYGNARVNGDINTVVRDSSATSIVAAGGVQGNSGGASGISYGNATVLVENSSVGDIYGAYLYNGEAYKQGASVSASGNSIKISVSGSSAGSIYAGGYGAGSVVGGDAEVVFSGSSKFAGTVYGGGAGGASVNGQSRVVFGSDGAAYRGVFMGGISGADAVEISAGSSVFFANSFDVEKLSVDSSSTVYLADGTAFGELSIVFGDETFSQGANFEFDMSGVFTDESVVVSALDSGALLTVLDAAGREWRAAYDGAASVISIGGQIPEPSVYAAILGALSLAAAAVRRRGNPNR